MTDQIKVDWDKHNAGGSRLQQGWHKVRITDSRSFNAKNEKQTAGWEFTLEAIDGSGDIPSPAFWLSSEAMFHLKMWGIACGMKCEGVQNVRRTEFHGRQCWVYVEQMQYTKNGETKDGTQVQEFSYKPSGWSPPSSGEGPSRSKSQDNGARETVGAPSGGGGGGRETLKDYGLDSEVPF